MINGERIEAVLIVLAVFGAVIAQTKHELRKKRRAYDLRREGRKDVINWTEG